MAWRGWERMEKPPTSFGPKASRRRPHGGSHDHGDGCRSEQPQQEGDLLHLVLREENAGHVYEVFESGPEED